MVKFIGRTIQNCEPIWNTRVLTRLFNQTTEEQQDYRRELTKSLFAKSGSDLYIEPPFRTDYGCQTRIGEHVYMNYDCIIIEAPVTIGTTFSWTS